MTNKGNISYWSLIVFENGQWNCQFGDYEREVVLEEKEDYKYNNPSLKEKDFKLIVTRGTQEEIDAKVNDLNSKFEVLEPKEERIGLFHGYKPNRLSFYLLLLNANRIQECYETIYKDMAEYKIEEVAK